MRHMRRVGISDALNIIRFEFAQIKFEHNAALLCAYHCLVDMEYHAGGFTFNSYRRIGGDIDYRLWSHFDIQCAFTTSICSVGNSRHSACPVIRRIKSVVTVGINFDRTYIIDGHSFTSVRGFTINCKLRYGQCTIYIAIVSQNIACRYRIFSNGFGISNQYTRIIHWINDDFNSGGVGCTAGVFDGVVKREVSVIVRIRLETQRAIRIEGDFTLRNGHRCTHGNWLTIDRSNRQRILFRISIIRAWIKGHLGVFCTNHQVVFRIRRIIACFYFDVTFVSRSAIRYGVVKVNRA